MSTLELRAADEDEMRSLAADLAQRLPRSGWIGISGDLGAGKTTLVRALVLELGGDADDVASPTFAIVHEYPLVGGRTVWHVDAYRLSDSPLEWESIGLPDLLAGRDLVFVEWPRDEFDRWATRSGQIDVTVEDDQSRAVRWTPADA